MNLRRVQALLAAELVAIARDRWTLLGLLGVLLLMGGLASGSVLLREKLDAAPHEEAAGEPAAWDCEPGRMPPVAAVGDVPGWLAWPDPLVVPDAADVLLRFGPAQGRQDVELVPLAADARKTPVRACLESRLRGERRARLAALGVSEDPRTVVDVRTLPPAPRHADPPAPPPLGLTLLGGLAVLLSSTFLELGPRARAAGWLETWLVLPGARWHLVAAWFLVGIVVGAAGAGVVIAGDAVASTLTGIDTGAVPWSILPVVLVVTSAVGVRAFLDVPDMRTAMAHAVPVLLGLGTATALAGLVEREIPGLGGLVPIGGLLLALGGGSPSAPLAALTALLAAALLLWDAARALDRVLVRAGALGRTAARRARGDYLPEVALLTLVAMAGTSAWAPPELVLPDVAARTALAMALFLALPALAVSVPLELDRRALLFWRAPPRRAWLLVPPLVAGTLTAGNYLWQLGVWLFPSSMIDAYADLLGDFDSPWGLVAVSLVPGVCEELLFRGAIFGLLRRRFPLWAALVGQAALFALLHAIGARLPYTFALGLVFGLLVWRTGSLWPAILAHAAHNFLATQLPPDGMQTWLAHPAAWLVAALTPVVAWFAGGKGFSKQEDPGSPSR